MSANHQINFWDQTISKWQFSGHFEFCNIYLAQEMQNNFTMNIRQNVMSHTRITHEKNFTLKIPKWPPVIFFFFFFNFFFKASFVLVSEQFFLVFLCSQEAMETYYQIGVLYCNFITIHFCFYPYSYPVAKKGIFH